MKNISSALELGATMYIPATHEQLWQVTQGQKYPELKSVVVCLEDSVHAQDVAFALNNLKILFQRIQQESTNQDIAVFVRPRDLSMAQESVSWQFNTCFQGFIVPKFVLKDLEAWRDCVTAHRHVMLTMESHEYFDMGYVADLKSALLTNFNKEILCLRIGGNDLLSCLNLRRSKDCTIYDTPIGLLIPQLVGHFVPAGFQLSSPVFEHYSNTPLLKKELALDKVNGLLTKTAIHPSQLNIIHDAYKVNSIDYYEAQMIMDANAKSVFKSNGSMLEPATHRNWAQHILTRAQIYGVIESHLQFAEHPSKLVI